MTSPRAQVSTREQATKARELIAKGLDPNEQKAFELAERRAQPSVVACTVRKLFEAWLAKLDGPCHRRALAVVRRARAARASARGPLPGADAAGHVLARAAGHRS